MLCFSFEMPLGNPRGPLVVVLILEVENVARMSQNDPLDIQFKRYEGNMRTDRRLKDVDLVIAYEEDVAKIVDFNDRGDIGGLMAWLERGRRIRPGDLAPPTRAVAPRPS